MTLMFLYTIMPAEIIFGETDDEEHESEPEDQEIDLGGVRLLVRLDGAGGGTVTRLLSTDPRDFLDRRWQPGSRVWI